MFRTRLFGISNIRLTGEWRRGAKTCPRREPCQSSGCLRRLPSEECCSLIQCGPCVRPSQMDIRCKVALVTGGACGIGFSIAHELLCQEAYRVVIVDRCREEGLKAVECLESAYGKNKACFIPMDVNSHEDFQNAFKIVHEKFGGADILVNNASVMKDLEWIYSVDTNLTSALRGTLLAMEWMPRNLNKSGVVLNISSVSGLDGDENAPVIAGTKAGLIGLTRAYGTPLHTGSSGVRVVALCPGRTMAGTPGPDKGMSLTLRKAYFEQNAPAQRQEKVAKAVNYVIRYGPNGSIWVAEDCKLFIANIPPRKEFSNAMEVY